MRTICRYHQHLFAKHISRVTVMSSSSLQFHTQTRCFSAHTPWNKAVSAAEKVVGYPTSFMNLRFWLSDEMSNVAVNIRKLIGTKHPLMSTAKGLLFDNKDNMQTRGLVVLLISKAAGYPVQTREFPHHALDQSYATASAQTGVEANGNGILSTQRSLAEITEMIHTSFVLHNGVMNINLNDRKKPFDSETEDLLYGNKMALLSGDYLLAKASSGLSSLGNTYVVETMASAISDLMESGFFIDGMKADGDHARKLDLGLWEEWSYKNGGCLYAKSCQSALMLCEHPEVDTENAFSFGKYFGLLRQMKADTEVKKSSSDAPENTVSIYSILSDEEIQELKQNYVAQAENCAALLPNLEARGALMEMVKAL